MDNCALLFLPRELRDTVYRHYFRSKDGYVTDFATTNIMNADGSRIDLALRLVCRQIATETRGLALQFNTITFQNTFFESAGVLQSAHSGIFRRKHYLLKNFPRNFLTADMAHALGQKHPSFLPLIHNYLEGGDWICNLFPRLSANDSDNFGFGEAPSLFRDFLDDFLLELSQRPDFVSHLNDEPSLRTQDREDAMELANTRMQTWKIYDGAYLNSTRELSKRDVPPPRSNHGRWIPKHTYSATSCAIRFLGRLSTIDRMDVRHVLLVENSHIRPATEGASHARGLIPFCRENPNLKITRRANLWHTVLRGVSTRRIQNPESMGPDARELRPAELAKGLGVWLAEYSVLGALGMPDGAYELIIDVGIEDRDKAAEVMEIVQRDAARQEELDMSYGESKSSWYVRRKAVEYSFECLPDMMRRMAEGRVGVRCDFAWASWRVADADPG